MGLAGEVWMTVRANCDEHGIGAPQRALCGACSKAAYAMDGVIFGIDQSVRQIARFVERRERGLTWFKLAKSDGRIVVDDGRLDGENAPPANLVTTPIRPGTFETGGDYTGAGAPEMENPRT